MAKRSFWIELTSSDGKAIHKTASFQIFIRETGNETSHYLVDGYLNDKGELILDIEFKLTDTVFVQHFKMS